MTPNWGFWGNLGLQAVVVVVVVVVVRLPWLERVARQSTGQISVKGVLEDFRVFDG